MSDDAVTEHTPLVEEGRSPVSKPATPEVEEAPLVEEGRSPVSKPATPRVEDVAQQPSRNPPGDDDESAFSDDLSLAQADAARAQADVTALTSDLQRLQAEYLNYKRRVERDRDLVRENATYAALAPITEVLDTIDRAREHGPLEEGLRAVAEQLERVVAGLGLVKYGAPGDAFDPMIHEALSHIGEDPEVTVTTCKVVARSGYRLGERVVRAAQVLVVDPAFSSAGDDRSVDEAGSDE